MSSLATFATETGFVVIAGETASVVIEKSPDGLHDLRVDATHYSARHRDGHALELRYVAANNGELWVECVDVESPIALLQRLRGSLRLTVQRSGSSAYCELRQAQRKGERWANLFTADYLELDKGAGVSVARELRAAGAQDVGTRQVVLADSGRRRAYLCAKFDPTDQRVPVLAFLLTRAMPLIRT